MGLFVGLIGDLFGFDGDCVSDGRGNRGWSSWKLHDLLINSKFVNNSVKYYPTTCIASLFQHKLTGDSISTIVNSQHVPKIANIAKEYDKTWIRSEYWETSL